MVCKDCLGTERALAKMHHQVDSLMLNGNLTQYPGGNVGGPKLVGQNTRFIRLQVSVRKGPKQT